MVTENSVRLSCIAVNKVRPRLTCQSCEFKKDRFICYNV